MTNNKHITDSQRPGGVVPKATGTISISYHVYCPHCGEHLDDYWDREWWAQYMPSFPSDGLDSTYEVECPKCKKQFDIDGFIH